MMFEKKRIRITMSVWLFIALFTPNFIHAAEAQVPLIQIGLGLGQAMARMKFYAELNGGVLPADQAAAIRLNLTNAAAGITAYESGVISLHTYQGRTDSVNAVLRDIGRFFEFTEGWSINHRSIYIRNLFMRYETTLEASYTNLSPVPLQARSTCDSALLRTAFFYGAATIYSAPVPLEERRRIRADYGQSYYVGMMRRAIHIGLTVGIDGYLRKGVPVDLEEPRWSGIQIEETYRGKLCCPFGTEEVWQPIQDISNNSQESEFVAKSEILISIARNARIPDWAPCPGVKDRRINCNEVCEEGGDEPETIRVDVNGSRRISFTYDMFRIKDRMRLLYNGLEIFDTGCVSGTSTIELDLSGFDDEVVVEVIPNCAGDRNTRWIFELYCLDRSPEEGQVLVTVPDLLGKKLEEAEAILSQAGLKSDPQIGRTAGSRDQEKRVISQDPAAGTRVNRGTQVTLTIYSGYPTEEEVRKVWELVEIVKNPDNKPLERLWDRGRYRGSYFKYKVEDTYMEVDRLKLDGGVEKENYKIRADFSGLPKILRPEDVVTLNVTVSTHPETVATRFKWEVPGINVRGLKEQRASNFTLNPSITVPEFGQREEIRIIASMTGPPCKVIYVYRPRRSP